ncbi:uncharacterized protein LOC114272433 [Camellia sinensis]|uniref:uncharacterized protein LOC114272433 n=1 Tax=Camellia sinensis TaxID=4442 RepID=UPI001036C8CB|nr:uncharacterized protein LOC114272433 [Camellia sinensis]
MVQHSHNDALVVILKDRDCQVRLILIDQGISCHIMYVRCYKEFGLHKDDLEQSDSPMVRFNGTPTWPVGTPSLEVQVGSKKVHTKFTLIDTLSLYNIILGRPWLYAIRVVPSTLHQLLRFPTEQGIEKVRGDQIQVKNYSMASMKYTYNARVAETTEIESEDREPQAIREVNYPTWLSNTVVIKKKNGM